MNFKNTPFIVAEMSANHNGCFDTAKRIVEAAAEAGADAIKLQTFEPEQMVGNFDYVIEHGQWKGMKLIDLYRQAHTPKEWHEELFSLARSLNLIPFSSPFHPDDVDFLETLDCPIYKISSFDIVDHELIKKAASTGKHIIISSGMATEKEIIAAMRVSLIYSGYRYPDVLKCTSAYPAKIEDANLSMIGNNIFTGLSDHTIGCLAPVVATALGAKIIEKHLTLSRQDGGIDSSFSMEPEEFKYMVESCRSAKASLGESVYGGVEAEEKNKEFRKSLWFTQDADVGKIITNDMVKIARPAFGINPQFIDSLIGARLQKDVKSGDPVNFVYSV